MKKFYFILFAIIFTVSCNKETVETGLQQNEQKEFLTFKTISDYESTISLLSSKTDDELKDWCKIYNPNAIIIHKSSFDLENLGIYDMLLASLLNKESVVAIENNVYKVDILKENVKSIAIKNYHNTADFDKKSNFQQFTLDDEILSPVIEERGYCYGGCGNDNNYRPANWYLYDNIDDKVIEIDRKIVYQRAGIYYSLETKIKRTDFDWGGDVSFGFKVIHYPDYWSYVNYYMRNKYDCDPDQKIPGIRKGGNWERQHSYRPYYATRRLRGFNFTVEFYASNSLGYHYTDTHAISCQ
jgi:hypothetical protein